MNLEQGLVIIVTPCFNKERVTGYRAARFVSNPGGKPCEVIAKTRQEAVAYLMEKLFPKKEA